MNDRLERLLPHFAEAGIDALYVTSEHNIHYLVGFGEESFLLVTRTGTMLFTDFRYVEEAEKLVTGAKVVRYGDDLYADIRSACDEHGVKTLGFESAAITHSAFSKLAASTCGLELRPTEGIVEKLRLIKEPAEIETIAQAARIADAALVDILPLLKPGVTENDLSAELKYRIFLRGASDVSFKPIIAFDANASLPHAKPGDRVLTANSMVQFDWGAKYRHYCSDCSRVFFIGEVPEEIEKIYNIVMEANDRAKAMLKPGASLREVDAAARNCIAEYGYGQYFGHGLGHGVGLEVHEAPRLNTKSTYIAREGMIVTIEAGIYLPGIGGIRVEDLVAITSDGHRILTQLDRHPRNPLH
ncbi:MAG: Xaa-Pro dipeptidase [Planctomycetota bacterium]